MNRTHELSIAFQHTQRRYACAYTKRDLSKETYIHEKSPINETSHLSIVPQLTQRCYALALGRLGAQRARTRERRQL